MENKYCDAFERMNMTQSEYETDEEFGNDLTCVYDGFNKAIRFDEIEAYVRDVCGLAENEGLNIDAMKKLLPDPKTILDNRSDVEKERDELQNELNMCEARNEELEALISEANVKRENAEEMIMLCQAGMPTMVSALKKAKEKNAQLLAKVREYEPEYDVKDIK